MVEILRATIESKALGQLFSRLKALGGGDKRNHRLLLRPLAYCRYATFVPRQERRGEVEVLKGRPRYLPLVGSDALEASEIVRHAAAVHPTGRWQRPRAAFAGAAVKSGAPCQFRRDGDRLLAGVFPEELDLNAVAVGLECQPL